ncbi:hypothetical protein Ddc_20390 [Ditylenchus destructor]|nr:hypothetical protein Ddc_20390 [Ditylenchus destructor]
MPALIIQGTHDIQVGVGDAQQLKKRQARRAACSDRGHEPRDAYRAQRREAAIGLLQRPATAPCRRARQPPGALYRRTSTPLSDNLPPVLGKTADKPRVDSKKTVG